jgi:transcriptional accessory protein Tex/SPT6
LDSVSDEDLVRLGPAGFVHLDLVSNISYLAAVAEDTFFSDRLQAERVANRIKDSQRHLHIQTAVDNAAELVDYLNEVRKDISPTNGTFLADDQLLRLTDISEAENAVLRVKRDFSFDPWFDAQRRLLRGTTHEVTVVNVVNFGCFVEFSDGLVGLVHINFLGGFEVDVADRVRVEILWVDSIQKKMGLKMVDVLAEDVGDLFTPLAS